MSRYPTLLNSNTFIVLPVDASTDEDVTFERLHELVESVQSNSDALDLLKIASLAKKLLLSLRGATLSLMQILKLWEIRLVALCFACGHDITVDSSVFKIQSVKFLKNEVDILIPELYKINKLRKQHEMGVHNKQQQASQAQQQHRQVESFPREVTTSFKFLLLRIRYGSSLMLVNEYYSHIWRVDEPENTIRQFTFGIIAALMAKQEYLTIISLIDSILNASVIGKYHDQLVLLKTLVQLLRIDRDKLDILTGELQDQFVQLDNIEPLQKLNQILVQVAPVYNDPTSASLKDDKLYSESMSMTQIFAKLQRQVTDLEITGRIICSLCAIFEIEMTELTDYEGAGDADDSNGKLLSDKLWTDVNTMSMKWGQYSTVYYGLE